MNGVNRPRPEGIRLLCGCSTMGDLINLRDHRANHRVLYHQTGNLSIFADLVGIEPEANPIPHIIYVITHAAE